MASNACNVLRVGPATILCSLFYCTQSGAVEFADQGSHLFTGVQSEQIVVRNGTELTYQGELDYRQLQDNAQPVFWGPGISVSESSSITVIGNAAIQCGSFNAICSPAIHVDASVGTIEGGSLAAQNGVTVANGGILRVMGGNVNANNEAVATGIAANASRLEISGGEIQTNADAPRGLELQNGSVGIMTGGVVGVNSTEGSVGVMIRDSEFTLSDGEISGGALGAAAIGVDVATGRFVMNGGLLKPKTGDLGADGVVAGNGAMVELQGGTIEVLVGNANPDQLYSTIVANEDARIIVSGGTMEISSFDDGPVTAVLAKDQSSVEILGGEFNVLDSGPNLNSFDIMAQDNSTITIHGNGFNYPLFAPIDDLNGAITGTFFDGTEINLTFDRSPSGTIMLVPEPSCGCLILVVFVATVFVLRQRGSR